MRLTKHDKDAFVRDVLDGVPKSSVRNTLEDKVTVLINAVTTLKAALKNSPEFAKYLPADRDAAGTANLPAANVIADLTNAGWPKK